jgi:hypothetical protein
VKHTHTHMENMGPVETKGFSLSPSLTNLLGFSHKNTYSDSLSCIYYVYVKDFKRSKRRRKKREREREVIAYMDRSNI